LYTGFQITEEYLRIGLTKVQKALDSKTVSRERKQLRINLARIEALVTMASTCNEYISLLQHVTPRSVTDSTHGSSTLTIL